MLEDNRCQCECKELIDKGECAEGYIWNPSNCECECNSRIITRTRSGKSHFLTI